MNKFLDKKYEALRLKLRKYYIKATYKKRRKKINCKDFTIISNNCWGGTVYQSYGLKYNTPTVGLFFLSDDYIKFVYNLKEYLQEELQFINPKESKRYKQNGEIINYPVAKLKDIEIYFMHYKTKEEAKQKWEKRAKRINWDKILYKFSNQNFWDRSHIQEFMNLPVKNKVCFVNCNLNIDNVITINQLIKSCDIKASYEPFGNKFGGVNINQVINSL